MISEAPAATATTDDAVFSPLGLTPRVQSAGLVAAKHARIVEAALPLFARHGFHNTTVRMIADAAGMSMGNLYQYIRRKEDVLYLAALHSMSSLRAARDGLTARASVKRRLVELLSALIDLIDHDRHGVKLLYRESASLSPEMLRHILATEELARRTFADLIAEGIANSEIADCDADILSVNLILFAHAWAIKGWTLKNLVDLPRYREEQVTNAIRMIPFRN